MVGYHIFLVWALRVLGVASLVIGLIMFVQTNALVQQGFSGTPWDVSSEAFTLMSVLVTSLLPLAAAEILAANSKSGSQK